MTDQPARQIFAQASAPATLPRFPRLLPSVSAYWLATVIAMALIFLTQADDFIGPDNDDVMRLVEVRDWLSGQGWFDLMQYRLGLSGGTLMHWSRFIDAPIGGLIRLFSIVMPMEMAENAAATVWPLLLCWPLLFFIGLAGKKLGGPRVMHIALGLGALFAFSCGKFRPGALDHHNVQLILAMAIAALLADRQTGDGKGGDRRSDPCAHALAGFACAFAIAVGAETVPFVATACACVALRWIWQGGVFAPSARAFGMSLALSISAAFFATVPPRSYAVVTCDNLSLGFYALSALGGVGLFALACLPARAGLGLRIMGAGGLAALVGLAAIAIAPQCLGSPLADLDPLLVEMWLRAVTEARSVTEQIRLEPYSAGGFYAVGLGAIIICITRVLRGEERGIHLLFLALLLSTWGVSLIQVRGTFFASLMSIAPFALLIAQLQMKVRANPNSLPLSAAFAAVSLAAVPSAWAVGGAVWETGISSLSADALSTTPANDPGECGDDADMAALRTLPTGTVASPSNSGAEILRFTAHSAIAAPYHRNQGGMLTELHIGMATPAEALAFFKGANVTVLAYCKTDPQTADIMKVKPDGLYAALGRGEVPPYLSPVQNEGQFELFTVNP